MKKCIFAFAIAVFAASVNAAQVAWKIQNVSTYDTYSAATPTKVTSSTGANYLIVALYSADSTISADFTQGKANYGDDVKISAFAPSSSGGTGTTGKKLDYDYTQGTYYFAVLFNSKGTTSETAFDYFAVSTALTGDPAAVSPATPLALTWQSSSQGWPAYTQTTAAPEPTSGLLLLLGMAGLALKRKRA